MLLVSAMVVEELQLSSLRSCNVCDTDIQTFAILNLGFKEFVNDIMLAHRLCISNETILWNDISIGDCDTACAIHVH